MANTVRFQSTDIVNDTAKLITSTWTNNTNNLEVAHTSSTQADFSAPTSSGAFYIEVYNLATSDTSTQCQYSVAYGHSTGSGSLDFTNDIGSIGNSPSKVIYNQYRQLVYGDENSNFSFNGHTPEDIYVININRSRYKHNLKPGTLDLYLSGSSTIEKLRLTDDSVTATGSSVITNAGRQFNIVSGALGIMSGSLLTQVVDSGSYGLYYPDSGFIILNPDAVDHHCLELAPGTGANTAENNHQKLFNYISGAKSFTLDSEEKVSSQFYFVRARNNQFNYTTNPSFIDNSGNVNISSFVDNPTTYITTVGLYNDANDLVAVAKLSQPVTKDFTKEALIRVKLDY